ncbi:MAG: lysylphosphatidylglycerol synthase domain-containing protein [Myxococcota bacterium]
MASVTEDSSSGETRNAGDVIGSYALAYGLMALLMAAPIAMAGVWDVLARTRLLDLLVDIGVVRYRDGEMGLVKGLDNLAHYVESQDPIHWWLVAACASIYLAFNVIKAIQFHQIARLYGMQGSFGRHTRAFLYGQGLNRMLPYATGDVAMVAALEGQGESKEAATSAVYIQDRFVDFEITFFFLSALIFAGWTAAVQEIFWAVVFVSVLWFVMRPAMPARPTGLRSPAAGFIRAMANQPLVLASLCALSIVAFFMEELTPYMIAQAFSSEHVDLNTSLLIIHGGVIAGYIASRVPVTPGAIGQFELGFGTALVAGGTPMSTAITIAVLSGVTRHSIGLLLFLAVRVGYGIETTFDGVMSLFRGAESSVSATAPMAS